MSPPLHYVDSPSVLGHVSRVVGEDRRNGGSRLDDHRPMLGGHDVISGNQDPIALAVIERNKTAQQLGILYIVRKT
ncbi:MAG: hypothetical protein ABSB69_18830 [Solirubrobacteraceae bacterium]